MAYVTPNYQIAAGNDNEAGLTAITALTDGTHTFMDAQLGLFSQSRGRRMILANGTTGYIGYPKMILFSDMLFTQWLYLKDNYEGLVTVTIPYLSATWVNCNAVLQLQGPAEMESIVFAAATHEAGFVGPGFKAAPWILTRIVAL